MRWKDIILSPTVIFSLALALTITFVVQQAVSIQQKSQYDTAVAAARSYSKALTAFSDFYLGEVTPKAKTAGIKFTDGVHVTDESLPLLYSLLIDLSDASQTVLNEGRFRIFSNDPWPMRGKGGPRDEIEAEMLRRLTEEGGEELTLIREVGDSRTLVYGTPVRLKEMCLGCHNTDTRIARNDYKVGEVRGVRTVELNLPDPPLIAKLNALGLVPTLILMAALLLGTIAILLYRITKAEREKLRGQEITEILWHVGEGVMTLCPKGLISSFNRSAERTFGYSANEVIGKPLSYLIKDGPLSKGSMTSELLENVKGDHIECQGRRHDGTNFPVSIILNKIDRAQKHHRLVLAVRDLTNLKRMEEQLLHSERLRTVGKLAGGIAHNFNNLLAVVIGNAEILEDRGDTLPQSTKKAIKAISSAATRGAQLSNQLLSFGRKQALMSQPLSPHKLLQNMRVMFEATMRGQVHITITGPEDDWSIYVDRGQMTDALLNLAANARDAMPEGGSLSWSVANLTEAPEGLPPGEYVAVCAQDSGDGIEPQVLEHVFEPFFTTKDLTQGTGLGLSMVHGFAHQSGGSTLIESKEGRGTKVTLLFPRYLAEPQDNYRGPMRAVGE